MQEAPEPSPLPPLPEEEWAVDPPPEVHDIEADPYDGEWGHLTPQPGPTQVKNVGSSPAFQCSSGMR